MRVFTKLASALMILFLSSAIAMGQSDAYKLEQIKLAQQKLMSDRAEGVTPGVPTSTITKSYATSNSSKDVLWDNGPLVTLPGGGSSGTDYSELQDATLGMGTYGTGFQISVGNSIADDFDVTGTWTVTSFTFFGYQTGSGPPSTLNDVRFQIYDGDPSAGGNVIFGDLTTNKMLSTEWTNIWRVLESSPDENRPIMQIVADASGLVLSAGTYWVEWQVGGTGSSGPWAPPITITGVTNTGNAVQHTSAGWAPFVDVDPQGMPFIIDGTAGALPDNDIGVSQIMTPVSGADLTNAEVVTVKIMNMGNNPQSNFDVSYTIDGGAAVTETVSATINSLETYDYTFTATADLSVYGLYAFEVCTMLAGDENADNDCKTKDVENFPPSYCDASTSIQDEIIGHVVCGDIDNTSDWQGGVADYTDQSTAIDVEGSEDITVTNTGGTYGSDATSVWVDWNDDFVFEQGGDEEFILENVGGTGETYTGTITVPAGTINGMHRMRVRMIYNGVPEPCGSSSYGEIEDYSIVVGGGGNAVFADDFEAYNAGEQVACQNPDDWTTWSNAPCGSEDAYVSDAFAYSGANSANVITNNDLVYELPEYFTTGAYNVSMMVYVPTGFDGYYNVLSDFGGGASAEWGFEVYFNVGGDGSVNAGATGAATFTFPFDTWMLSEVVVDLDNDIAQYYLDGNMIIEWAWTAGAASGGAQLQLAALDFFGATATTSFYFDDFAIEDVTAPPVLDPPTDLANTVNDNDVTLTWTAPGGGGNGEWIEWDNGENNGEGVGLTNGGTFLAASRWMPDELTNYNGMSVTQLSFYANGDPDATYIMKIWTGDNAGTEVMSQDVATFTVDDFNIVDLTSPVTIDASMQYWFGYEITHTAGTIPAGMDPGPAVQESGDMISIDGVDWVGMAATYNIDHNWNIAIYVDNLKNAAPAQAITKTTFPASTGGIVASNATGKLSVFSPNAAKDLTGYNVYRDGDMIGSTTETTYTDMDLAVGTYEYCVTAVYDAGESECSNTTIAIIEDTPPPPECEGFDNLAVDDYVALELGGLWTTWSNAPGTAEDAVVSDTYSLSPSNAALVEGTTDLVLKVAENSLTSGVITYMNDIYVPTGFTGYWNLQKTVVAGEEWAFQIHYDDDMMAHIDAAAEDAVVMAYENDTWYHNEVVIDLNNDWCQFYIDGTLIIEYQWTLGTFGTPGLLTLGSTNIFAAEGTSGTPPGAYFDNVCFNSEAPPPLDPPTNLTSTQEAGNVVLNWDAPGGGPVILVVDRDGSADLEFTDTWQFIQPALDANGFTYDYHEVTDLTTDGPDLAEMANYDVILWFTGESWQNGQTMSDNDEINLSLYLSGGGSLLLSAHDFLWDRYPSAGAFSAGQFPYDYLGLASVVQDSWTITTPDLADINGTDGSFAAGLSFQVADIYSAKDGLYIDNLTPLSQGLFDITNPSPAGMCAVQYEGSGFRTAFTTASIAAITDAGTMADVLSDAVNWLSAGKSTKELTGYNIYHNLDGGTFSLLGTTTETTYTHEGPSAGLHCYYVTAVYDMGESTATDETCELITGVEEILAQSTAVFPNPATDVVNIKSDFNITDVKVYNYAGQIVRSVNVDNNFYQLNSSELNPGFYFFQINTTEGSISKRIVIQ
jgi:hypothetical protein